MESILLYKEIELLVLQLLDIHTIFERVFKTQHSPHDTHDSIESILKTSIVKKKCSILIKWPKRYSYVFVLRLSVSTKNLKSFQNLYHLVPLNQFDPKKFELKYYDKPI